MISTIAERLLAWYAQNARRLPWRDHPTPYTVWISEIMLQQTRVETVIPYFERWMERFPNLATLAAAPLQDVLAAWEGLGYYGRSRNLLRAAQIIIAEHGGELPLNLKDLQGLPGIGRYTAAAIASIAFGRDEAALDGNIRRVLARLFDVRQLARSKEGERRLWELAAAHLPPGQAGEYNQALMDLGATLCSPRQPDCPRCPLNDLCQAYALGLQEQRPVTEGRPAVPHYTVTAAVIQRDGQVLIAQRPSNGLLGGMWEFPGGKTQPSEDLVDCLRREIREEMDVEIEVIDQLGIYRHAYTHFRVTLHAFRCNLLQGEPHQLHHSALAWASLLDLPSYPMGKIDRMIASHLAKQTDH